MVEDERMVGDASEPGANAGRALATGFAATSPLTGNKRNAYEKTPRRSPGPNFVTLWIIVSGLWTLATVSRLKRAGDGWPAALNRGFTWLSLLPPPVVFAGVPIAMSRVANPRHRPRC
jgi:hypothetical protein